MGGENLIGEAKYAPLARHTLGRDTILSVGEVGIVAPARMCLI